MVAIADPSAAAVQAAEVPPVPPTTGLAPRARAGRRQHDRRAPPLHAAKADLVLHCAISAQDWQGCRQILSSPEANELVQKKNTRSTTPLMLAGQKGMPDDVLELMLALPGISNVVAFRQRHQTAADIFDKCGNTAIAERLRTLEKQIEDAPGNFRCPICRDKVQTFPMMSRLGERVARGEETNPLVLDFFSRAEAVQKLNHTAFHRVTNCQSISKEISETMAVVRALLASVDATRPHHVVDLCCGRGITAAYVAAALPDWHVTAVDRASESGLPHYEEGGLSNVRFMRLDLFDASCSLRIRERTDEVALPVVVLGMHCCGQLSLKVIEVYEDIGAAALVLCPCCLPMSSKARAVSELPEHLWSSPVATEKYTAWATFLSERAAGKLEMVKDIMSPQNAVISAPRVGRHDEQ